jgi:hypothetical protein
VRRAEATYGFDCPEEIIEHVAPVAEHIDDDSPVVLLAVIPRRALRQHSVAFENPVAEFATDAEQLAEEALVDERFQFHQAGQPEFVLHNAVFHAGFLRALVELVSLLGARCGRFFAIDVFSGSDCLAYRVEAAPSGLGVEVDGVGRITQCCVEISRVANAVVHCGELRQLCFIPPNEDRLWHNRLTVPHLYSAIFHELED